MKPTKLFAVFTRSSGLIALIVRLVSRRPGQALKDVAGHCYFILKAESQEPVVYESILEGVRCRALNKTDVAGKQIVSEYDLTDYVDVTKIHRYLERTVKQHWKYRIPSVLAKWFTVFVNSIFEFLKVDLHVDFRPIGGTHEVICSELLQRAIGAHGGFPVSHWLSVSGNDTRSVTSPNDLALALCAWYLNICLQETNAGTQSRNRIVVQNR